MDAIAFVRVRCNKAMRARFDKTTLRNIICIRIRVLMRVKKSVEVRNPSLSHLRKEMLLAFCIAKMHIFSSADVLLTHDYGLYLHSILNSIAHIIGQCFSGRSLLSSALRYRYRYSLARRFER